MPSKISVVILNYNTKELLEKFLPSVLASNHEDFEVVVADNNSSDGSVEMLQNTFPTVSILETGENLGYAGGYNRALRDNKSKWYVLLNSDVEVHPNWLKHLDESVTRNNWSAIQPKILDYNKKENFEYAGASGGYLDYLGYPLCRGRLMDSCEVDEGQYNEEAEIHWASGAALMIKGRDYWEAGGLDEDFFAHMEEIDLCWRLHKLGKKIGVSPMAEVYHIGGGTLSKQNSRKTYLNFRNGLVLLLKNLPLLELLWKFPFRLMLDGAAGAYFLAKGKQKDTRAIVKAHWNVFLRFGFWWKKRAKVQKTKHRMDLLQKSLVFQYYLKGVKTFKEYIN